MLAACIAVLLGWTSFAQVTGGLEATISYKVWEIATKFPFGVFLLGCVAGHLLWRSAGSDRVNWDAICFRRGDFLPASGDFIPTEEAALVFIANAKLRERLENLGRGE